MAAKRPLESAQVCTRTFEHHANKFWQKEDQARVLVRYAGFLSTFGGGGDLERDVQLQRNALHVCSWLAHAPARAKGLVSSAPCELSPVLLLTRYFGVVVESYSSHRRQGRSLPLLRPSFSRLLPLIVERMEAEIASSPGDRAVIEWKGLLRASAGLASHLDVAVRQRVRTAQNCLSLCQPVGRAHAEGRLSPKRVRAFYAFLRERESLRVRKERGEPPPWTDDACLAVTRLTNVHRHNDRTTRIVIEQLSRFGSSSWGAAVAAGSGEAGIRSRRACARNYVWNIGVWRRFGTDAFVRAVGWSSCPSTRQDLDTALGRITDVAALLWRSGVHACTGAYKPATLCFNSERGAWRLGLPHLESGDALEVEAALRSGLSARSLQPVLKRLVTEAGLASVRRAHRKLADGLRELWTQRHAVVDALHVESAERTWRGIVNALQRAKGVGEFLGKELAQDLLLTPICCNITDLGSYSAIGIGGQRGLNRIAGRQPSEKVPKDQLLAELRALFSFREELWPAALLGQATEPLTLHDIQFQCCEFDKYQRKKRCEGPARAFDVADCHQSGTWLARVDVVLDRAGGQLGWPQLQAKLLRQMQRQPWAKEIGERELGLRILAFLPEAYLSSSDPLVRRQPSSECEHLASDAAPSPTPLPNSAPV